MVSMRSSSLMGELTADNQFEPVKRDLMPTGVAVDGSIRVAARTLAESMAPDFLRAKPLSNTGSAIPTSGHLAKRESRIRMQSPGKAARRIFIAQPNPPRHRLH